ncbi:BPL-N domain-containing protein, partial [Verrucomicrobiales bacterium]|nr:BPL-N domain-containing protein [Verrucomicrobiales bacterium]
DPLVQKMVAAADATVADPAKYFSMLRRGPVSTGLTRACINVMGAESLILETTYNEQPMSIRTRQHRAMTNVLLNHIGVIDGDCSQQLAVPESNDKLQVALFDGVGTGPSSFKLMNLIDEAPDLSLFHIGPNAMKSEILKQFDVVVFPGGSGSKQGGAIGEQGRTSVREFIESGGGYVGVCAGAYLCSANYRWSLDLIDSRAFTGTVDIPEKGKKNLWYRGPETAVDIELTAKGEALFGSEGIPKNFIVRYANGPIITRHGSEALEDYQVLAWFRSENSLWEKQKGTMINTPAIISGRFGKGRVVSVSPHPELTPELHPIIIQAIRWGAQHLE